MYHQIGRTRSSSGERCDEAAQHTRTFLYGHIAPGATVEGVARGTDGSAGLCGGQTRQSGDDALIGWIVDDHLRAFAVDKFAVDEAGLEVITLIDVDRDCAVHRRFA